MRKIFASLMALLMFVNLFAAATTTRQAAVGNTQTDMPSDAIVWILSDNDKTDAGVDTLVTTAANVYVLPMNGGKNGYECIDGFQVFYPSGVIGADTLRMSYAIVANDIRDTSTFTNVDTVGTAGKAGTYVATTSKVGGLLVMKLTNDGGTTLEITKPIKVVMLLDKP